MELYNFSGFIISPFKLKYCSAGNKLPLNDVGLVNYITIGWLSRTMWKSFKVTTERERERQHQQCHECFTQVGLTPSDVLELSEEDDAQRNGERFERLWEEEGERCGEGESPSLPRVVWRFARVRFIISLILIGFSMVAQFIGPSVLLKLILEYLEDPSVEVEVGIVLLVLLFFNQLVRNITYNLQQAVCIHTGRLEIF